MIWQTIQSYWKSISVVSATGMAILGALWAGSGYVVQADDRIEKWDKACVTAQVAKEQSDQALDWQRLQMEREKAEARSERKKWREIVKLCMDGTIKDQKVCAEAMAALK